MNTSPNPNSRLWALLVLAALVVCLFVPSDLMAGSAESLPWESPLAKLSNSLTGPVAQAICLIAIVICGLTLIFGGEMGEFAKRTIYIVNHVFRIFRDALMLSFISAGAQLSQPRKRGTETGVSADEQIAAAMGQQFGAAGMELARRNAQVQPTLQIRPGFQFAVMVTKDVVLSPYERSAR